MAAFSPQEWANYLRHAGRASKRAESALLFDLSNTIAGVSDIAQISDGQRPKSIINRYAIPKRSVFIHAEPETHMGVRGLAPKPVGRKEIPCKYLQSFKGNR